MLRTESRAISSARTVGTASTASRTRTLVFVGALCLVLQAVSATFVTRDVETPNAAASIGRHLASAGAFVDPQTGKRAYHLPGEPLYLAAGFRLLPESAWRYFHVPVVVLLVTGIASAAFTVGGPLLALSSGIVTSLEPFVLVHGPVWDDIFLATALAWSVFAMLLRAMADGGARPGPWLAVVVCAAAAAITRLESQLILGGVAVAAIALKSLRPIRSLGWAVSVGLAIGLGAWGFRNAAVVGHFFVGSSHDGKTLEESTGANTRAAIFQNSQAGGSGLFVDVGDEVLSDRQLQRLAWRYISAHPVEFAKTAALKMVVSLLGLKVNLSAASSRNLVAFGSSLVLLIAGVWGLRSMWRHSTNPPAASLLALLFSITAVVTVVLLILGPVGLRYRLNLTTFLCLGMSAALSRQRT